MAPSLMKVEETTLADFDRVFAVNVRGVFVAPQAALKHLKSGGRILMIGLCLGERVFIPGMAPYSASKEAHQLPLFLVPHGSRRRHPCHANFVLARTKVGQSFNAIRVFI